MKDKTHDAIRALADEIKNYASELDAVERERMLELLDDKDTPSVYIGAENYQRKLDKICRKVVYALRMQLRKHFTPSYATISNMEIVQ